MESESHCLKLIYVAKLEDNWFAIFVATTIIKLMAVLSARRSSFMRRIYNKEARQPAVWVFFFRRQEAFKRFASFSLKFKVDEFFDLKNGSCRHNNLQYV